jgi:hypothetical protein
LATHTFDIVVLGGELGGLIAATLCAARGYRVALVGDSEAPTRYRVGELSLPIEPFAVVGLEAAGVQRVIDELHFTHLLRRKLELRPGAPGFQLVCPEARIDAGADDDALARELERELGSEAPATLPGELAEVARALDPIVAGDESLASAGFRRRRENARALAAAESRAEELLAGAPPLIESLLSAPAAASCPLAADQLTSLARARAFDLWRRGTPRIEGDLSGLREVLLEKFASHGGERIADTAVELSYSWGGKISGLTTRSGDTLGTGQLIAALPIDELAVVAGARAGKKLMPLLEAFEPAGYRYTLNLVVDEAGIPEGMGPTVLCVADPDAPLVGANLLRIHRSEPDDRARVVVSIAAICPAPAGNRTLEDEMADLRVAIREAIELVMPFVSQHIVLAHSPHEPVAAEGRLRGSEVPVRAVAPRPTWRIAGSLETSGLGALPHQPGIKNLVMCSSQVMPSLGLEAEFIVALGAAELATQGVGKRKPAREILASR